MIGFAFTVAPIVLAAVLIPLRFARAVRRSLRDPEFRRLFLLVVMTLAAGTVFYWRIEGWGILDAFYFSVIVLMTVGLGDIASTTAAGKLFTVFYIFAGLGIILGFVNAVARASVEQRGDRKRALHNRPMASERDREED